MREPVGTHFTTYARSRGNLATDSRSFFQVTTISAYAMPALPLLQSDEKDGPRVRALLTSTIAGGVRESRTDRRTEAAAKERARIRGTRGASVGEGAGRNRAFPA